MMTYAPKPQTIQSQEEYNNMIVSSSFPRGRFSKSSKPNIKESKKASVSNNQYKQLVCILAILLQLFLVQSGRACGTGQWIVGHLPSAQITYEKMFVSLNGQYTALGGYTTIAQTFIASQANNRAAIVEIYAQSATTEDPPTKQVLLSTVSFPGSSTSVVVTGVRHLWGAQSAGNVLALLDTTTANQIVFLRVNLSASTYVTLIPSLTACTLPTTGLTVGVPSSNYGIILATDCTSNTAPNSFYTIGFSNLEDASMTSKVVQISAATNHSFVKLIGIASLDYDDRQQTLVYIDKDDLLSQQQVVIAVSDQIDGPFFSTPTCVHTISLQEVVKGSIATGDAVYLSAYELVSFTQVASVAHLLIFQQSSEQFLFVMGDPDGTCETTQEGRVFKASQLNGSFASMSMQLLALYGAENENLAHILFEDVSGGNKYLIRSFDPFTNSIGSLIQLSTQSSSSSPLFTLTVDLSRTQIDGSGILHGFTSGALIRSLSGWANCYKINRTVTNPAASDATSQNIVGNQISLVLPYSTTMLMTSEESVTLNSLDHLSLAMPNSFKMRNPCKLRSLTTFTSAAVTYTIGDPTLTSLVASVSQDACPAGQTTPTTIQILFDAVMKDGTPATSPYPIFADPGNDQQLHVYTNDILDAGTWRVQIKSAINGVLSADERYGTETLLTVAISAPPICSQAFTNPTPDPNNVSYTIFQTWAGGSVDFDIVGAFNGYCEFSLSISDALGNPFGLSSPYSITQPVLEESQVQPGSFSVTTDGYLTIFTQDKLQQGVQSVIITLHDLSTVGSTLTSSVTWNVTLMTKCQNNIHNPNQSKMVYAVYDPLATFELQQASNGDCEYTASLGMADGSTLPAFITLTSPTFTADSGSVDVVTISTYPLVNIQTNDPLDAGTIYLRYTVANLSGTESAYEDFKVEIQHGCVSTDITTPTIADQTYYIYDPKVDVEIQLVAYNQDCLFSASVKFADGSSTSDPPFQLKQPTFYPFSDAAMIGYYTQHDNTRLKFRTDNFAHEGIYNLVVTFHSETSSTDTYTEDISFQVTMIPACTKNRLFSSPTLTYTVYDVQKTLQLSNISNGLCQFSTQLLWNGSQTLPTFLTYTPETIAFRPNSLDVYNVVTTPYMTVQTNDPLDKAVYTLKMRIIHTPDGSTKDFTFYLVVKHACETTALSLPTIAASTTYEIYATPGTTTITMLSTSNQDCGFQTNLSSIPAIPSAAWTFNPAVLTLDNAAQNIDYYNVQSEANLVINTSDTSVQGTYQVTLTVLSQQDGTDTRFGTVNFEVVMLPACVQNLVNSISHINYYVYDPLYTKQFTGVSDGDCQFFATLTLKNGNPLPSFMTYTGQSMTKIAFSVDIYTLDFVPQITIQTNDPLQLGRYDLRMRIDNADYSNYINEDFHVTIKHLCETTGLTLPTIAASTTYEIYQTPGTTTITMLSTSNQDCGFQTALSSVPPIPTSAWTFNPAVLTPDTAHGKVNYFIVSSEANLVINTSDVTVQGVYQVTLTVQSQQFQDGSDTRSGTVNFEVIMLPACITNLVNSMVNRDYNVYDPIKTIQLTDVSDGDCQFHTTLTLQDGTPLPSFITYTPESMTKVTFSVDIYTLDSIPQISIVTNDPLNLGRYNLRMRIDNADYSNFINDDFHVTIYHNCETTALSLPTIATSTTYEIYQTPGTTTITMLSTSNQDCGFQTNLSSIPAIPSAAWTFYPAVLTPDTAHGKVNYFIVTSEANLVISTSDVSVQNTYQVTLTVLSQQYQDGSDTRSGTVNFEVIMLPACITNFINGGSPQLSYYVYDTTNYPFNGISDGDCQFFTTLTKQDGSPVPSFITFTPEQMTKVTFSVDIYTLDAVPMMDIQSNDPLTFGQYMLTLRIDNADYSNFIEQDFNLVVGHACETTALSLPTIAASTTYEIYQTPGTTTITMLSTSNQDCGFQTELSSVPPIPTSAWTFNPAVLTPDTTIGKGYYYFVTSEANLVISTSDVSIQGTYQVTLTVLSQQNPSDTRQGTVNFEIIMLPGCISNLVNSGHAPITYYVHDTDTFTFNGVSDGDCQYLTTLTQQDGTPLPSFMTFTPQQMTKVTFSVDIYTLDSAPQLVVNTSDKNVRGLYTLTLKVENANQSQETSQDFTVEVYHRCESTTLTVPTIPAATQYEIIATNPIAYSTTFSSTFNMFCQFSMTLTLDSGDPITTPPFTFTPAVITPDTSDAYLLNYFTVTSEATFAIFSNDPANHAKVYAFTLTVHSEENSLDTRTDAVQFQYTLIAACDQGLSIPTLVPLTATYLIYPLTAVADSISLTPITNGFCQFSLVLSNADGSPHDSSFFTLQQPNLTFRSDSFNMYDIGADGAIVISTTDVLLQGVHSLQILVNSDKNVADSATATFQVVITAKATCDETPIFTPVTILYYTLTSPVAQTALVENWAGTAYGNCQHTAQLSNQDGTPHIAAFTLTQPTQQFQLNSHDVYSVLTTPSLTISASDTSLRGNYPLRLTLVRSDGVTSVFHDFTVTLKALCVTPGLVLPTLNLYRYQILTPFSVYNYLLGPVGNNFCNFSISLANQDGTSIDPTIFTYNDLVLAPNPDQSIINSWVVSTDATLSIQTDDLQNINLYDLRLTINSLQDAADTRVSTLDFQIRIFDNPCEIYGGLSNVPANNALDISMTVGTPPEFVQDLGPINNGKCQFMFELSMFDPALDLDLAIFKLKQPIITPENPGVTDPRIVQVVQNGEIVITSNEFTQIGTYDLKLRVISQIDIKDVLVQESSFTISLLPCSRTDVEPDILVLNLESQNYYAGDPAKIIQIEPKISCTQTSLRAYMSSGSELNSNLFTFTYDEVERLGELKIETADLNTVGQYTLKIEEIDLLYANTFIVEEMTVTVADFCQEATLTASSFGQFDYNSGQGPKKVKFDEFQMSGAHATKCAPIKYELARTTQMGSADSSWFVEDAASRSVTIDAPEFYDSDVKVLYNIEGTIQGNLKYSRADSGFTILLRKGIKKVEKQQALQDDVAGVDSGIPLLSETQQQTLDDILTWVPPRPSNKGLKQNQEKPRRPQGKIVDITADGIVTINFSKPIIRQSYFKNLQYHMTQPDYIELIHRVISVRVVADTDYYLAQDPLAYSIKRYTFVAFEETSIKFRVEFERPDFISVDPGRPDQLEVTFITRSLLNDQIDYMSVKMNSKSAYDIPNQMSTAEVQQLAKTEKNLQNSMQAIGSSNLIVNLALSYTLKYMWNLVNLLQMAVFIPTWKVGLPEETNMYLKYLKSLSFLEFFDTKAAMKSVNEQATSFAINLGLLKDSESDYGRESESEAQGLRILEDEEDFDDDIEEILKNQAGQKSSLMDNMAIMILIAIVMVVGLLVLLCIRPLIYCDYRIYRFYAQAKQKIFYNMFIRYSLQSALKFEMAGAIAISQTAWGIAGLSKSQGYVGIGILLFFTLLPFTYAAIIYKNLDNLDYPSVRKKMGSLYSGCYAENHLALAYSFIFLVRRLIFVALTFTLSEYPQLQALFFVTLNVAYLGYLLHTMPIMDNLQLNLEIFNEFFFLVCTYHLIILRNPLIDKESRFTLGMSLVVTTLIMIVCTFSIIIFTIIFNSILSCRQKYRQKVIKKKQEAIFKERLRRQMEKQHLSTFKDLLTKSDAVVKNRESKNTNLMLASDSYEDYQHSELKLSDTNSKLAPHPDINEANLNQDLRVIDFYTPVDSEFVSSEKVVEPTRQEIQTGQVKIKVPSVLSKFNKTISAQKDQSRKAMIDILYGNANDFDGLNRMSMNTQQNLRDTRGAGATLENETSPIGGDQFQDTRWNQDTDYNLSLQRSDQHLNFNSHQNFQQNEIFERVDKIKQSLEKKKFTHFQHHATENNQRELQSLKQKSQFKQIGQNFNTPQHENFEGFDQYSEQGNQTRRQNVWLQSIRTKPQVSIEQLTNQGPANQTKKNGNSENYTQFQKYL